MVAIFAGANIMCPGLTHANVIEELKANPVPQDTPVCILAEGKDTALAVGHTQVGHATCFVQERPSTGWHGAWHELYKARTRAVLKAHPLL